MPIPIRIAVLVDGGFFVKRHSICYGRKKAAEEMVDNLFAMIKAHVGDNYLYRVLYYDCTPFEDTDRNPISKELVNFANTDTATFRRELFEALKRRRKAALRLGYLKSSGQWHVNPRETKRLLKGTLELKDLTAEHISLDLRQKGVDMKIGLDIASLAYKRAVDQIVLISGDSDMIPAIKLARREGMDVVLDAMWNYIEPGLWEHVDGVCCHCPKPKGYTSSRPDQKS